MRPPKIFIASSSQAFGNGGPADELRRLLKQNLRDAAEVAPWTLEFALGATSIESLEQAVRSSDFAVIVATADDLVTTGEKQKLAARDNVVFELGLFMGAIGRE